jgi:hypothetical protein
MTPIYRRFPSLEAFNHVFGRETYGACRRSIDFGMKIKLHGSNFAINIQPNGAVNAQSRNMVITLQDDLNGFAEWLQPSLPSWSGSAGKEPITVFGEWAGPGVGKGDAIQRTDRKRFFIFAIGVGQIPHEENEEVMTPEGMITCPDAIARMLGDDVLGDDVRILPWHNPSITFDFAEEDSCAASLALLNDAVEEVDKRDPYVMGTFGVDHPGEGFVLTQCATTPGQLSYREYSRTAFKTKTEKHRVRKQGRPASAREPLPGNALEFVETFVTPARVNQAVDEVADGAFHVTKTGDVMSWMIGDIRKEAGDEIDALGLPFKKLQPAITAAVRTQLMRLGTSMPT